jgi:hypothetical protein
MVLKELASEILPILSIIYNVSIKVGEIPDQDRLLLKPCCRGHRMLFLSACLIMWLVTIYVFYYFAADACEWYWSIICWNILLSFFEGRCDDSRSPIIRNFVSF